MRVVLVGAGAVGTLLGWALASSGAEVAVLRRPNGSLDAARRAPEAASAAGAASAAEAVSASGRSGPGGRELVVIDPSGVRRSTAVLFASDPAQVPARPDLLLCAVKAFDLPAALATLTAWPSTPLMTVQNGIGAEEDALAARPGGPLLTASLTASVERSTDGSVRWLRRGGIGLAVVQGDLAALGDDLGRRLADQGLPARAYPDWRRMKWSKLLANLVGNATSAVLDLDPGAIQADPALSQVERGQLREALAVMAAQGLRPVDLPGAPVAWLARALALPSWLGRPILVRAVGGARGGKSPSLRLHLASAAAGPRAGSVADGAAPSEIEQLNGAVVAAGRHLGVPTPVNAALVAAYADVAREPARRAWYRAHPAALLGPA